jgi:hypothetical protein
VRSWRKLDAYLFGVRDTSATAAVTESNQSDPSAHEMLVGR